ncbi:MAG TPA: Xaa-Pro peptidase family protein [Vicinamibacterales bacterium]|nr:Xaa-Pro peptidase family protein [Vicinamibacterales bacterium]
MPPERLLRVQEALGPAGLDGLLVTHPPNIRYLTGLNASAGMAIVSDRTCLLLVDFRYATVARELAAARPGLEVEVSAGQVDVAAVAALRRLGLRRTGVEGEHLPLARFKRLEAALTEPAQPQAPGLASVLVSTERFVERMRAVKDAAEIEILREAGRRISAVAREARHWVVPGRSEIEVAAAVDAAIRRAGFERPAFDTIVASGPNSALPHARPTRRILATGEGVVLDFGGVYDGYCVDLTRTLHLGPMPADFRRMFEAVREAQAAAIAAIAPGAAPADIDGAARGVLEAHGLGEAFGHGTGHGLGLEVHEEPRISKLAPAGELLAAGMVFTIEPGAYVPGTGGVRIEDDVLVVAGGCERLTDVPIEL